MGLDNDEGGNDSGENDGDGESQNDDGDCEYNSCCWEIFTSVCCSRSNSWSLLHLEKVKTFLMMMAMLILIAMAMAVVINVAMVMLMKYSSCVSTCMEWKIMNRMLIIMIMNYDDLNFYDQSLELG